MLLLLLHGGTAVTTLPVDTLSVEPVVGLNASLYGIVDVSTSTVTQTSGNVYVYSPPTSEVGVPAYSTIITGGLGLIPACCGVITAKYGLNNCVIEVIPPPIVGGGGGGGGGGSYAVHPGIYVPWRTTLKSHKQIQVMVKMSEDLVWRKSYTTPAKRRDVRISTDNFTRVHVTPVVVNVDHIKRAHVQVTAIFKDDDKYDTHEDTT
jgi:hypothetical protein